MRCLNDIGNKIFPIPQAMDLHRPLKRSRRAALWIFSAIAILAFDDVPIWVGHELLGTDNGKFLLVHADSMPKPRKLLVNTSDSIQDRQLHPELFGINSKWLDNGGGIIEYGEMIKDRSFRNQRDAALKQWLEFPEPRINGVIKHVVNSTQHGGVISERSYPGYMNISQDKPGYTCLSQQVLGSSVANQSYELHISARKNHGTPMLSVFFADDAFLAIEELDNLARVGSNNWADYSFILEPEKTVSPGLLRICNIAPGSVDVDEVRLRQRGGDERPIVSSIADLRIRQLGVKSIRWPAGTDADRFLWKESIGILSDRGENIDTFGKYQTTSWGLHEFLDYCEQNDLVPLITVNVTDDPENSADLVEYILGSPYTPMGQLRENNGRQLPWNVRHFELGNEPTPLYQEEYDFDNTSLGYIKIAKATAIAMSERAEELGVEIELQGVVDATFAAADWISAVPMLSSWNANVLDHETGLIPYIDSIKGNFYSAFTYESEKKNLYDEVMAGGSTLATIFGQFNDAIGPDHSFWLTEYSVFVQRSFPDDIDLSYAKDFQSGLAVADLLMTAIKNNFGGAYLFNLSEEDTWGVLANNTDFRLRPGGIVFSMLAQMAGEYILPVSIENNTKIKIKGGKGNNPGGMEYEIVSAIATYTEHRAQLYILNRSYNEDIEIELSETGFATWSTEVYQYASENISANNEENEDNVKIVQSSLLPGTKNFTFPPRSLTRIVLLH